MANPLNKRFPRELRNNIGKYLGLFFMMLIAVAFTGGYLLAANSMETILNGMKETYRIEDGHFVCDFEADDEAIKAVEKQGVTVYPDFYRQVPLDLGASGDGTSGIQARMYANRSTINLAAYAEGRAPQTNSELALDRVFMDNHDLHVGDTVKLDGKDFGIVGICTLPDYQSLFENNTDFVQNALTFTVGQLTPEGLATLSSDSEAYAYSFVFNDQSLDLAQRTDIEEEMIEALTDNDCVVADFVDAEDNQAIGFAIDDITADRTIFTVILFVLIAIMSFVFTVLTGATIESESNVIGTLLASGWRKGELLRHYLTMPVFVGLASVVLGLVVGTTLLSDPLKNLYYNSYSIPPYELHWDASIVFFTTVLPFVLLMFITVTGLLRKLRFTPLQFLRRETASRKRRSNLPLPDGLRYVSRFRLRVLLRNASHFVTLFFGITFASLLLLFGICLLPVIQNYAIEMKKAVVAPHQYVLKTPLELEGTTEEREMYAAALRLIEDHDRIEANQDAIDAAERLNENKELMDAIERLNENEELMDALDRLQDNDELIDALERLQDNEPLMNAFDRLQGNNELMDILDRMKDQQHVTDAAKRLQGNQALVDAAKRLQGQTELTYWLEWAQLNPAQVQAATRVAAGSTDPNDLAYIAALSDEERAGLHMIANIDAQTQSDIDLVQNMDEQTKADMELLEGIDDQTKQDLEYLEDLDQQTKDDIDLLQDVDDATQADIDLLSDLDEQTQADIDLLKDLDDATQADIDLVRAVDDATKADIDLVRSMDESLLDDVRLAADIDEDAHVVNTQENGAEAIEQAEKFAMASVEIQRAMTDKYETVTVYGIQPNSRYWTEIPVENGVVYAGRGTVEKTVARIGEPAEAFNRREGESYTITVAEATNNEADVSLYMTLDDFNRLFGNDVDYFNAYASGQELKLDKRYLGRTIVPEDMDKISAQMEDSMGSFARMMLFMAIPIYLVLVYLLTKTVIDRSARSISYMKVFGYQNKEVNGLYVRPITYWVLFSLVASLPLIVGAIVGLLKVAFLRFSGNFPLIVPPERLLLIVVVGMVTYGVVAFLHVRRIKKVPLELAMKVQE